MADFVRFILDDGSEVLFESAEADLVSFRGDVAAEVSDGGRLRGQLEPIAAAAGELAQGLLARLSPDTVTLELGVKVSGGVNWFFAKSQAEAAINVTLTWSPAKRD